MGYIGNEPTTGHFPVDNFTSSGGSTYTLAKAPASAGAIEVSVQGVLQPTTAYTVSGTTLNMAGVTTGVKIFVRHLGETLVLPTPADGSVTASKLGTNSVDGTKIAMGSDAAGDILYHGASDYARLPKGTAGQALVMNSGATAPEWGSGLPTAGADGQVLTSDGTNWASEATAAGGKIVQVVNNTITSANSGTTQMPIDNTIPTSSEGNEFITLAITPTNASNKLLILINLKCGFTAGGSQLQMALFQDSTSAAIAANATARSHTGEQGDLSMNHYMTAGTTIATTFKVRVGANIGGTMFLNSNGGGRLYGGVSSSTITIMEIAV